MSDPAVCKSIARLRAVHRNMPVVLVPTMGALHAGHLSLATHALRLARTHSMVCVSIFVNPLQFERQDDLEAYPRSLDEDVDALANLADTVYAPAADQIYPSRQRILVTAPGLDDILEGEQRTGHFAGVLTVLAKLFCMIEPVAAVFGRKDYQQLVLVRMMCSQIGLDVRIEECPVVRDRNGLALSSRNSRLTAAQRLQAAAIHQALRAAGAAIAAGADPAASCRQAEEEINAAGLQAIYVKCVAEGSISEVSGPTDDGVLLAAARLAGVRLIDCVNVRDCRQGKD